MTPPSHNTQRVCRNRRRFTLALLAVCTGILLSRAVYLQLIDHDRLRSQGDARTVRTLTIPAHRGMIVDRHGEPLAVSSPVGSIWADPTVLLQADNREHLPDLAEALDQDLERLTARLEAAAQRRFIYLQRHLPPTEAQTIIDLGIGGVYNLREYRRYYPDAEVSSHLIGFADIDDRGREGLELQFDQQLSGVPGSQRVLQDRRGRVVEELGVRQEPQPGQLLQLSIDRRIQYYAYRALKVAVAEHRAVGGSIVVLDPHTGEILAMANQPSVNPNDWSQRSGESLRNRAVTDLFEPGSLIKPFPVAVALDSGKVQPTTIIDTQGWLRVGRRTVRDIRNFGPLSVTEIITRSSNIGVVKLAQMVPAESLWTLYRDLGFGSLTGIEFPGERQGILDHHRRWVDFEYATRTFGYGLSTTALQMAQAYAVLATEGVLYPPTLLKPVEAAPGQRVMAAETARQLKVMMETVTGPHGTARRALVPGYQVAGKTGTVHKVIDGAYDKSRYMGLFAGMVPASRPDMVAVIVIDEPRGDQYYGGAVAAPVFRETMREALRIRGVLPDAFVDTVNTAAR